MSLTREEIDELATELQQELKAGPLCDYVYYIGTTYICVANKKNRPLPSTVGPEDWCLIVYLRKRLPKTLSAMREYKSLQVFVEILGTVKPL